jgi:nickel-type superoxide dismutase maturation protease
MQFPSWIKPFIVRRMMGVSMSPKLQPGQLIIATRFFRKLKPGQVVIVERNNKEIIKRIERIEDNHVFIIGDNLSASKDSRHIGWLEESEVVARVLRPNLAK